MNDIKAPLKLKIAALKKEIPHTIAELMKPRADYKRSNAILSNMMFNGADKPSQDDIDWMISDDNTSTIWGKHLELRSYRETLALDLVHITTDYAIVSASLTSPAGYHPSERVFVQPAICIPTNDPKQKPPSCNVQLYLTTLKECDKS